MKHRIISIIAALSTLLAVSCEKGDGDVDYGNSYIYIPQATANGGINNYYNVPSGGGENTYNFKANGENVDVFLGVLLSGKAEGKGFSVSIVESSDQSSEAANALGASVLPSSAYSLPTTVTVESGKNSASFALSLSKSFVQSESGIYVLALGLANPSAYELSSKSTSVVVVIDTEALKKLI